MKTICAVGRPDRFGRLGLTLLGAIAFALAQLPAPAPGQEADEMVAEELYADGGQPSVRVLGTGGFIYQSDADIDGGGSVQVFRYDLGVAAGLDIVDRLHWRNTFFFAANDYDFSGGSPWNTI